MAAIIGATMEYHNSGIAGAGPAIWYGITAPDGAASEWYRAPVGSIYIYKLGETTASLYQKRTATHTTADWVLLTTAVAASVTSYGAQYLRNWPAQVAKIQAGSTAQASVALLGDSWIAQNYLWLGVQSQLQTLHGDGGRGYMSIGGGGYGLTFVGTWSVSDEASTSRGIDATHRDTIDDATPANVHFTTAFTDVAIHYIARSGGGSFRYRVDSGDWTTVDTDNGGAETATFVDITTVSSASHLFTLELVTASTNGIRICGLDATISGNAVVVHKLGNSGGEAQDIAEVDETMWAAQLTELNPTTLVILFGTNECQAGIAPATYAANLTTIIARARAALPLLDIVLFSPGDNALTGAYDMAAYAAAALVVAQAQNCAYLSGYQSLGPYADSDARGLMADTLHPNADGYMLLANALCAFLAVR